MTQQIPGSPFVGVYSPEEERREVAARLADIRARLTTMKAEEKRLAGRLRALVPVGSERVKMGDLFVTVTQPMKFSEDRARELLAPEVLAQITRTVEIVDQAMAESVLPGAAFLACKVPAGEPRITFGK